PHIARLLDGGRDAEGRPYVAMEYVEGVPIDVHCAAQQLDLPARLRLFQRVCDAVDYAHRNLVLHRDLKPANLLVTADGAPKLLDFGIAKVIDPEDAVTDVRNLGPAPAPTALTQPGLRLLTPTYASPEQIRGEPLTTASDVYALGVLLYQLLTDRLPYVVPPGSSLLEMERTISEVVPRRMSDAIDDRRRRRALRGDLDTIVATALRKTPARRYASAAQLGEDLARHLAGEPVRARPDTVGYRLRTFVRRNRVLVTAAALIVLSLLIGLTTTAWQAQRAQRALTTAETNLRVAETERTKAERTVDFLSDLFIHADPALAQGDALTVGELVDSGAEQLMRDLDDVPAVRAELMDILGQVHHSLGRLDQAEPLLRDTLTLRRQLYAPDGGGDDRDPAIARSLHRLGTLLDDQGRGDEAEQLLRQSLALHQQLHGADARHVDIADGLNDLGALLHDRGQLDEAETLLQRALTMRQALLGPRHAEVGETLNNLAVLAYRRRDLARAEQRFLHALALRRRALGDRHPMTVTSYNNLAAVRQQRGDTVTANVLYQRVLQARRLLYDADHPRIAETLNNLALLRRQRGDVDGALRLFGAAEAMIARSLGDDHPMIAILRNHLGDTRLIQGDAPARAADDYAAALAIRRAALPADHWQLAYPLLRLGLIDLDAGRIARAVARLDEAARCRRAGLPANDRRVAETDVARAVAHLRAGRNDANAQPPLAEALDALRAARAAGAGDAMLLDDLIDRAENALRSSSRS
ncbi:MAG: serine/threonine-protein kinase, partial [Acidobacteriota bacterium]